MRHDRQITLVLLMTAAGGADAVGLIAGEPDYLTLLAAMPIVLAGAILLQTVIAAPLFDVFPTRRADTSVAVAGKPKALTSSATPPFRLSVSGWIVARKTVVTAVFQTVGSSSRASASVQLLSQKQSLTLLAPPPAFLQRRTFTPGYRAFWLHAHEFPTLLRWVVINRDVPIKKIQIPLHPKVIRAGSRALSEGETKVTGYRPMR
jgi:hypothetical protein